MSWLYTIFFTGLMFNNGGHAVAPSVSALPPAPPQIAVPVLVRPDETEKFDKTYPLNPDGRVSLSNINGSVTVEAWDRNEVRVVYTKTATTKELLADVDVQIRSFTDRIDIETNYDNWKTRNGQNWRTGRINVDYHLTVPRTAFLNEIEAVNGSVTVSNFTNYTKVSAVNGAVSATNLRGAANLSTVNGQVAADFDRLESGSKIVLSTVNGRVNLAIPSDSNATINADSLNGAINNDFGLPVRKGKYVGRDLYGKIGSGDVRIKLDSVNGPLTISRKNDGRPVSPATDLLPKKAKDDNDWDNDADVDVDAKIDKTKVKAQVDREALKAIRDSQKETAKAVKAATKELVKIDPAIANISAESLAAAVDTVASAAVVVNSKELQQKINEAITLQNDARIKRTSDAFHSYSLPVAKIRKETYAVKGVPKVSIDALGCFVRVKGWARSEVQYRVTQYSDRRNTFPIDITDSHTDSTVNVKVENASTEPKQGNFTDRSRLAIIEVYVPERSDLTIRTNGEIRVEGVSGKLDLSGSDEVINVRDSQGFLSVSNSDGRIRVIGFDGEVNARTSDGEIELEGNFKKLSAVGSDGTITLTLPESASADLEANCPEIKGDGIAMTLVKAGNDKSVYRIGNGGAKYTVRTGGEIQVRGAATISESN